MNKSYESPLVKVVRVEVEQGFAGSGGSGAQSYDLLQSDYEDVDVEIENSGSRRSFSSGSSMW